MSLHSIYDLTTFCRKTTGDVPAKLVGASTTVVGSKMYLFGGRLVTERKMVSDLYVFDLETFVWERVSISPDDDVPKPRYFHSADTWNNRIIIFGGMSNQPDSLNPDELCVLNDVRIFDISTGHWIPSPQAPAPVSDPLAPRARYAHLSSVTADRLFIIGGQDFNNTWLDDVCVYDLVGKAWVQRRDYPRHCGTYRSVAVSSNTSVRLPQEEMRNSQSASTLGPLGQRFGPDKGSPPSPDLTPTESLLHLPYSAPPSEDHPSDIYLYSNYNFTDVKRELEVFSPLPDTDFTIQDKSSAMAGTTFPPGLRFPTGAILGTNLIIAGTYLAHSYQSFSIWVLDLITMTWSRIDPGKAVESGSWFRGCLWAEANKFLIFGNRTGNLVDDYNRRLLSWDHVAVVDLEAFGIYQPPPLKLDITMQELGLAALEERVVTDFEIVCDDGRKISCSRKILEERWPWFLEQRKRFMQNAKEALENLPSSAMHVGLPELPGTASGEEPRLDPRLTPRSFYLSEPYPITMALLQYFYTLALVTPLQHAPAVLSQLLVLSVNYDIKHLQGLVKHAMHRALSNSTSVGVYEVATLCSCRSLQIRALKTVMSYTQKRPSRSRGDREPGGGGKPPGGASGGAGPSNGGAGNDSQHISRPRGTSDARWRTMGESNASGSGYNTRNNSMPIDLSDDDQITPLPNLNRTKSQHRSRSQSVVSVYTDHELHALADFMSTFADLGGSKLDLTPEDSSEPYQPVLHTRADSISNRDSGSSLSVATVSYSDSDHHQSSDGHTDRSDLHPTVSTQHRQRPPRIYTDSIHGSAPSLTSSASYSSISTGRYTSPVTPLTSSTELPSFDLAIIDERLSDDGDGHLDSGHPDPFGFLASEHRQLSRDAWPQQKSNIVWVASHTPAPEPTHLAQSPPPSLPGASPVTPKSVPSPELPQLPPTPRSATGTSFARFLTRKKDKGGDPDAIEEKRAKKAALKAKREKEHLEKLKRELGVHPVVMGGMLALGGTI